MTRCLAPVSESIVQHRWGRINPHSPLGIFEKCKCVLGLVCSASLRECFGRLILFFRGSCYIFAALCRRSTLFQTPERWLRSSTPMTRFARPSRWCTRQMVPPTRRWTVPSTPWCTSIRWKPLRHVNEHCVQFVYSSVNSLITSAFSLPVTTVAVGTGNIQIRFVLSRSL